MTIMMPSLENPCSTCGRPIGKVDGGCAYCLLQLGLSGSGTLSGAWAGRASLAGGATTLLGEGFLRQGVLPSFGDYELESEIARGGMGVVYRARQRSLNRVVAIKMILAGQLATPESVQRFRMEAEAAARLHHPGIVPIYEIGEIETQHFFSMKLIDGVSLAECLSDFRLDETAGPAERRQQEQCIAGLLARVARALEFAHQRGVLHRDLKPSNILIDEEGEPHLTDFGLAKLTGREASGLTLSNAVLGTPGYLAPEQAAGRSDVTTAVDVYGLGATLYELLTGKPPFSGSTAVETMWMAIDRAPKAPRTINPSVHRDLETIAMRCLEKSPEKRYRSAETVADELERFVRREPIHARPVRRVEHLWRWCVRNPGLAGLASALTVAIFAGSGAALWQWRRAEAANVTLTKGVVDLEWVNIDDMLGDGQSTRALAKVASLLRHDPNDVNAAMFAMSVLEQRRFPVPAAPQIRHPDGNECPVARLSPDGKWIATASFDKTARIWDAVTSREIVPPLMHDAPVAWADFSPDSHWLATCSEDKTVRLWDVATGKPRWEPRRETEPPVRVRFSLDGRRLLVQTPSAVSLVDAADGHVDVGPLARNGVVVSARFLSDGVTFFTAEQAGENSRLSTWDVATGTEKACLKTKGMRSADVSNDLKRVVTVDSAGRAWLADFPSGERLTEIVSTNGFFDGAAFSPRGDRVATTNLNQWARVWDAQTGQPITDELPHYYLLNGVAFIGDGDRLLTWGADALARVWDIDRNKSFGEPIRQMDRVAYAEAGRVGGNEVILSTVSHLKLRSLQTRNGATQLWKFQDRSKSADLTFGVDPEGHDGSQVSPDGRLLAVAHTTGSVRVFDAVSGALVCGPMQCDGPAWGLLFSPDASRLVTTTANGQVAVWSIPGGRMIGGPGKINSTIQPSEISRDGRFVATGSTDGIVRLWDATTAKILFEMRHGSETNSVSFSPDGRLLASAGEDRVVRLWDTHTGKPVRELIGHHNEVMTVFFSADGKRMVTGSLDFTAGVWDTATGSRLLTLPHQGEVLDANFSPDGRYVATASRDRTAVIWDAATGLPHSRSLLHEQGVRNVQFSPDGAHLLTLDFSGLRLWDVATGHPLTVHLPHMMKGGTGFQSSTTRVGFTADGKAALVACDSNDSRLWHFSTPPAGAPAWFPEFLEAVAGQRLTADSDRPEIVPPEAYLDFVQRLQRSADVDYYTQWALQWVNGSTAAASTTQH